MSAKIYHVNHNNTSKISEEFYTVFCDAFFVQNCRLCQCLSAKKWRGGVKFPPQPYSESMYMYLNIKLNNNILITMSNAENIVRLGYPPPPFPFSLYEHYFLVIR